jgi:hypothetical protein
MSVGSTGWRADRSRLRAPLGTRWPSRTVVHRRIAGDGVVTLYGAVAQSRERKSVVVQATTKFDLIINLRAARLDNPYVAQ